MPAHCDERLPANALRAVIPAPQLLQRVNDVREPSFGLHRGGKGAAPVGTVHIDGSGIIRQRTITCSTVMNMDTSINGATAADGGLGERLSA